ncbi:MULTISPECIES: hypothetical protein [Actinoplanes]|uniref:hypothetical protein n=1 Tax=Actinoplanes TaxID=1865 RepID=UPI0012F9E2DF|nr:MULTISPECIES: hypothetical protein [Actinoplanes]
MTNWMTAAGLAFIAGGLATLISFRTVLFGGGGERTARAAKRRAAAGAEPSFFEEGPFFPPEVPEAPEARQMPLPPPAVPEQPVAARQPIAADQWESETPWTLRDADQLGDLFPEISEEVMAEQPVNAPYPPPDVVETDDRPPTGDYWTPVPDHLYADPERPERARPPRSWETQGGVSRRNRRVADEQQPRRRPRPRPFAQSDNGPSYVSRHSRGA